MKKILQLNFLIIIFWCIALSIFLVRFYEHPEIGLLLTPFLTLILIFDYHRKVGKNQAIYFIFFFCMLGDLMVFNSDFYYFTSGLIAYWGAAILMNFTLNRELTEPFSKAIKKPVFYLPFTIYGVYWVIIMVFIKPFLGTLFIPIFIYALTLSLTCAMSIGVYLHSKSKSTLYFAIGLLVLSLTASVMGINRFYQGSPTLYAFEILLYAPTLYYINKYFKSKDEDAL